MKAAILGGGVIGGGWAARFLLNGWDVDVFDPDPQAPAKLAAVLANARHALPMLYDTALPPEGALRFATLQEAVAGADWVQESVPERLELKTALLAQVAPHLAPHAVLGSSTSGFKPSDLAQGFAAAAQLVVAHPFNPVYLLPLVELVPHPGSSVTALAAETLAGIGMFPLTIRAEIDAHIADRLLESVWREALWLIRDDIATTAEIDEAIRMGFGLRWGQMGLFETYRIAGGEAGMAHFLAQFGPALKWPCTRLTDVPELDIDLVGKIAAQSDTQAGTQSIRDLERLRDNNLVAMLRALKQQDAAAGAHLNTHQARLPRPQGRVTVRRTIPVDWTDYNGHMNESRYGQVWSDAADAILVRLGVTPDYVASGGSYFTVDTHTRFRAETHAGDLIETTTTLGEGDGRKLMLHHEMRRGETLLAACDQLLIHVSLATRRASDPPEAIRTALAALRAAP